MLGDYTQLGPVKADSVLKAIMEVYADKTVHKWLTKRNKKVKKDSILPSKHKEEDRKWLNHPYRIGAEIMTSARWCEMTQK